MMATPEQHRVQINAVITTDTAKSGFHMRRSLMRMGSVTPCLATRLTILAPTPDARCAPRDTTLRRWRRGG